MIDKSWGSEYFHCSCDGNGFKCLAHQYQEAVHARVDALMNVTDEEQDRRMAAEFGPLWTGSNHGN